MKVYINDMLVRSTKANHHIANLEEAFDVLRWHQIKINPYKYAFDVTSESFQNSWWQKGSTWTRENTSNYRDAIFGHKEVGAASS